MFSHSNAENSKTLQAKADETGRRRKGESTTEYGTFNTQQEMTADEVDNKSTQNQLSWS